MRLVFELNQANLKLSKAEVIALAGKKSEKLIGNLLILDTKEKKLIKRLAFTKAIYQYLFDCNAKDLQKNIKKFNWQKYYEKNFRVTAHHTKKKREIADLVWDQLKKPKVKLRNTKTDFNFFFFKDKVVACKLIEVNREKFEQRRAHLWPAMHPTAMHPAMARALINLTGIKKGVILDPMCGGGGLLIEARLMGFTAKGIDINQNMLDRAKKNLKHFKVKAELKLGNALKLKGKIPYIVTDIPYGINTPEKNIEKLAQDFLKVVKKVLTKKAVIMFPNSINYKKLIKQAKLKPEQEFSHYVHQSLTRKIVVLAP